MQQRTTNLLFSGVLIALLLGLILSFLAFLGTCTEACAEGHKYRLLGLSFGTVGIAYFLIAAALHLFSWKHPFLRLYTGLWVAAGLGSELMFILIQKINGAWCPICLGIASLLLISAILLGTHYFLTLKDLVSQNKRNETMSSIQRALGVFPCAIIGLLIAFFGVTKVDENAEEQNSIEQQIVFGNEESDVNIYVFTSWTCSACRRFEPTLERIIPEFMDSAQITFVDFGEEMTTLNFLPYNLSFMLNNKDNYLQLRQTLKQISNETKTPTDAQVEKAAKELGVNYTQLNYGEIALAVEYFKDLARDLKITAIPAVVIQNKKTAQKETLTGLNITRVNLHQAVKKVSNAEAPHDALAGS